MKNDVIASEFTIECFNGSLKITAKCQGLVVFCLCGDLVSDLKRDQPQFCKNAIFTNADSGERVFIFEYSLAEELRNPRKLLKSVRNKLVQASFRNQCKEDKEYHETYTMPDREEHKMFQ